MHNLWAIVSQWFFFQYWLVTITRENPSGCCCFGNKFFFCFLKREQIIWQIQGLCVCCNWNSTRDLYTRKQKIVTCFDHRIGITLPDDFISIVIITWKKNLSYICMSENCFTHTHTHSQTDKKIHFQQQQQQEFVNIIPLENGKNNTNERKIHD